MGDLRKKEPFKGYVFSGFLLKHGVTGDVSAFPG